MNKKRRNARQRGARQGGAQHNIAHPDKKRATPDSDARAATHAAGLAGPADARSPARPWDARVLGILGAMPHDPAAEWPRARGAGINARSV